MLFFLLIHGVVLEANICRTEIFIRENKVIFDKSGSLVFEANIKT
jgi:hypothetical protein